VGTGGIKPCVSSFVGDQFLPGQVHIIACEVEHRYIRMYSVY
jgi:dipeptide/tripeptide permease